MAVVYAVQNPHWKDRSTGRFVPKYDLSSCEEYGELRFLLSPTAQPFDADDILATLTPGLSLISEDDFILLIGNPVLIALVSIEAAENVDHLNFLQWNGIERRYTPISVDLGPIED